MGTTVFHYPKCGTCRKALKWLKDHGIEVEAIDISTAPPTAKVLRAAAKTAGVPLTKLFNTSGQSYRNGDFKTKLATMSEDDMLTALAADGMLIKRPLVIGKGFALVGFSESAYAAQFENGNPHSGA